MSKPLVVLALATCVGLLSFTLGRFLQPTVPAESSSTTRGVKTRDPKDILTSQAFLRTQKAAESSPGAQDRWAFIEKLNNLTNEVEILELRKGIARLESLHERQSRSALLACRLVDLRFAGRLIQEAFGREDSWATELMQAWARRDGDAFSTWLTSFTHTNNPLAVAASGILAKNIASSMTLEEVSQIPGLHPRTATDGILAISRRDAMADPEKALKAALAMPEPARWHALTGVAAGWAKVDVKAALAWAKQLPEIRDRVNALNAICREQIKTDPDGARATMNLIPSKNGMGRNILDGDVNSEFAMMLAATSPEAAAKHIRDLDAAYPKETMLAESVLPFVKDLNVKGIAELFSGVVLGGRTSDFASPSSISVGLVSTLVQWAPENPVALLQEVATLPEGDAKACMLNYFAWRVAQEEPTKALELAAGSTGMQQERLVEHVVNMASQTGDFAILEKAQGLIGETLRAKIIDKQVANIAKLHPDKAANLIPLLPEIERPRAAAKVAAALTLADPQKALELGALLPPDKQLGHLYVVGNHWAKDDPIAAGKWVQSLPVGSKEQQEAVAALSHGLARSAPDEAFAWARNVQDRATMVRNLNNAYYEWIDRDSYGASLAVQNSGLSPQEVAQVVNPPENWSPERMTAIKQQTLQDQLKPANANK
jgi:hypothetical protein